MSGGVIPPQHLNVVCQILSELLHYMGALLRARSIIASGDWCVFDFSNPSFTAEGVFVILAAYFILLVVTLFYGTFKKSEGDLKTFLSFMKKILRKEKVL